MSKVVSLSNEPATLTVEQVTALVEAKVAMDNAKKDYEALLEEYHARDIEVGVKYNVAGTGSVLKTESIRNTFDSKKFQVEHPEEYQKYLRQSKVVSVLVVPETKALVELS